MNTKLNWISPIVALALTTGASFAETKTVIRGKTGNGDFEADKSKEESRLHIHTPNWFNLSGSEGGPSATRTADEGEDSGDGSRFALLLKGPVFINDTGHTVERAGEVFQVSFDFKDRHPRWHDDNDAVDVFFFTTEAKVDGYTEAKDITELAKVSFKEIEEDGHYEKYSNKSAYTTTDKDVGKTIHIGIRVTTEAGYGGLDNFVLKVKTK